MGLTNFPNGISSFGLPIIGGGVFPGVSQGNVWFVKPSSGLDSNSGKSPARAVKTLARAHELATANQNDIVYLFAEHGETAASTTDYQSSTLDWSKNMVHLIGVASPVNVSNRARIAFLSTYDTASNLFTLSANGCLIHNISMFAGVAGTNPTGCLSITGDRNVISNSHIAGIGHANNDIAGAYSLQLSSASENRIVGCTIGLDTIARGTGANSEILFGSASTRNKFEDCDITTYAEAATHVFVIAPASSVDRYTIFKKCRFINMPTGVASGTTMTAAMTWTAGGSPDGCAILDHCMLVGATDWTAADNSKVFLYGPNPGDASGAKLNTGLAHTVDIA